ncbi:interferon-induced, double-stranded RNA-activated protein kinase [Eudromia elegans]
MERDCMAKINQYCQKNKFTLEYSDVKMTGPSHSPEFTVVVKINEEKYGEGTGKSKKEARAAAAKTTWEMILRKDQGADMQLPQRDPSRISSTSGKYSNTQEMSNQFDSEKFCFLAPVFDKAVNKKVVTSDSEESLSSFATNGNENNKNAYPVDERFLKDFENIVPIGEGGFGNVFKVRARIDRKTYAVKRVQVTRNVMREVKELAGLDHENIVRYYCSWKGEDYVTYPDSSQKAPLKCECLFIQMELCEQGTLENWVENNREKRKYQAMARDKLLQIVKGVEYIHSKGLIHRDLKPQNIFISNEDKIKIGDFGLVTSELYNPLTENRGTKSYMAPEQFGDTYGKEVDIYALGLIWFETVSALASHHEKYTIWKDVKEGNFPKGFTEKFSSEASMIKKMLSKDHKKRPSASQIRQFVESVPDNQHKTRTQ